jgi:glyoxylase-like metal-dependent hydrolase (beta-lactamase superfamily II)
MSHANPGIHHIKVGEAVVTALNDGQFDADIAWVTGMPAADAEAQLRAGFRVLPPRITVTSFLVRMAGRTILVDSGAGNAMGHVLGHGMAKLATLGVAPDSIDSILITHLHADHFGGLLDGAGGAAFPNAELVINEVETGFWLNKDIQAKAPEAMQGYFTMAQNAMAAYSAKTRLVQAGAEVLPGITAVALYGHTPGHTGFTIASGNETLLIWADVVHLPGLQFAHPEAAMAFDTDADMGRATRARALDMVATDKLLLTGMHLDFPTFGHVSRAGTGYAFEPLVWAPTETGLFDAP